MRVCGVILLDSFVLQSHKSANMSDLEKIDEISDLEPIYHTIVSAVELYPNSQRNSIALDGNATLLSIYSDVELSST